MGVVLGSVPDGEVATHPHVKNFAPNFGHDYGGRLVAAWLDR